MWWLGALLEGNLNGRQMEHMKLCGLKIYPKQRVGNYTPKHCCPWKRAKIPPYRPLCGAVIADYGGKPRNIGQYLALRRTQKPPCISAIVAMAPQFDNTAPKEVYL